MAKPKLSLYLIVFLVLAVSCILAYSNSLSNPFIWDDQALVFKNPYLGSWTNLPKVFTSDLYPGITAGSNFYRPLQTISYIWDYHFWQLEPFGYHLSNIILQILVAFLVFLFSRLILKDIKVAFAAALLFALHPLHTEAVTYISGRAEMLMAIFLLAALLLFMRGYRGLSLASFICALLSKELAVVFPFVLIAYLFFLGSRPFNVGPSSGPARRFKVGWIILKPVLPFLFIDLIYLFLRSGILHFATIRPPALTKYPMILRILVFPDTLLTYLRLFILPVDLHMSWTVFRPMGFLGLFRNYFLLAAICLASAYILRSYRKSRAGAFMLAWFLIFLLPQSGILAINAFIAEHFIYLSSISFFMLLAYFLHRYLKRGLFVFSVIGFAFFYGLLTYSRNFDWRDPLVFYSKIIKYSPDSFQAHNNLGLEYEYRHDLGKAILEYKKALEIEPQLIEARSNLANAYFKTGKFKAALWEYAQVEKAAPPEKAGELQNNIGCIYEVQGLTDKALSKYKLALQLDPGLNFAHFNIARIYAHRGRTDLATKEILKSLPEIGLAAAKDKRYREEIAVYAKASDKFQSAVIFYNDLGVRFAAYGLMDGAIAAFKRVIELDPLYADAHFNLGLAFWKKGLQNKAIPEFKRTLKINPNHLRAKGFLSEIIYKK